MDRRDTLKALLITGVAGTAGAVPFACAPTAETQEPIVETANETLYGRTPEELEYDKKLFAQASVFTEHDLATIAILCDIILPATATAGSATDAEVPAFIDFIVKDMPNNQLPLRGGLMWIDREANTRYRKFFKDLSNEQQIAIVDDIAYPSRAKPEMKAGVAFFNRMRNMTLTGYYTSKMGIEDLGYQGNRAGIWDGVPDDVLKDHDVEYDATWLAKCVDQDKRMDLAEWDQNGNLLT